MDFELTASMMYANYAHLEQEVKNLEEGGIDSFHIDIMDGRYVPNYAMSLNDMRYIYGNTIPEIYGNISLAIFPSVCYSILIGSGRAARDLYDTDISFFE